MQIAFVMNPTSWNKDTGAPWPGGMADALVQPILAHLDPSEYRVVRMPEPDCVNVYYTHRSVQGVRHEPGPVSVFVSHGIADKNWRNNERVGQDRFDWVFVSGPAWVHKLTGQGMPVTRICEVGYAKIDPLFDGIRVPRSDDRVRVLYAPTHGGGGEKHTVGPSPRRRMTRTSHWQASELLGLLDAKRFDVRVAVHPRHRPDKRATVDEYRDCDVVIADGGSTIYEAWALDLPVVFPSWLTGLGNQFRARHQWTFEAELYKQGVGYHCARQDMFARQVVKAAERGITLAEQHFVEPILPRDHRGRSGLLHAQALQAIAAGIRPVSSPTEVRPLRYRSRHGIIREVMPGTTEHHSFEHSGRWSLLPEEVTV